MPSHPTEAARGGATLLLVGAVAGALLLALFLASQTGVHAPQVRIDMPSMVMDAVRNW